MASAKKILNKLSSFWRVGALVIGLSLVFAGSWFEWLKVYEYQAYDWRFQQKSPLERNSDIAIIEVWDDALQGIGSWPFDRKYHAILLDILREYEAKIVSFDILFVEPSASDELFSTSAKQHADVIFAEALNSPYKKDKKLYSSHILAPLNSTLEEGAKGVGHVNAVVDSDGKRRRIAPIIQTENITHVHLGVLTALKYLGMSTRDIAVMPGKYIELGDGFRIPIDDNGEMLIDFSKPWRQAYHHYSYLEILAAYRNVLAGEEPEFDLNQLKGKVCFIGLTATGTHDIGPVPIDPLYPQVGIHAEVMNNVLQESYVKRLGKAWNAGLLLILIVISFFASRISKIPHSIFTAIGVLVIFIVSNILLFSWFNIWADLFYPVSIYVIIYLTSVLSRAMQEMRKRELIENELSIASKIQRSFLPNVLPKSSCVELQAYMNPAKHVGGDLYTMYRLDNKRLGIMCGDVSGKGMPAALFMSRAMAEFKFHSGSNGDPAVVLNGLNDGLSENDGSGLFVTVNYMIILEEEKKIVLSNGGAMPILRVRADKTVDFLEAEGGMPIGLMGGVDFYNKTDNLSSGDIFVLYSDGISEARNKKKEDYEMDRLQAVVIKNRHLSCEEIKDAILKDVEKFVGGAAQHDDMTLLVIKAI